LSLEHPVLRIDLEGRKANCAAQAAHGFVFWRHERDDALDFFVAANCDAAGETLPCFSVAPMTATVLGVKMGCKERGV
jgi:hypothetical protein